MSNKYLETKYKRQKKWQELHAKLQQLHHLFPMNDQEFNELRFLIIDFSDLKAEEMVQQQLTERGLQMNRPDILIPIIDEKCEYYEYMIKKNKELIKANPTNNQLVEETRKYIESYNELAKMFNENNNIFTPREYMEAL